MSDAGRVNRRRGAVDRSHPPVNAGARPQRLVRSFRRFLADHPITVLDIGARGGIPVELRALRQHLHLIAMEPDPEEAVRLEARVRELGLRSSTVLQQAAGPEGGAFTLHVTRDPGRSSLLEPNAEVIARYGEAKEYAVVRTVPVRTAAIGPLLASRAPAPLDLLKLDVQGFELEVLQSLAPGQISRLLMLAVEVEFVELYRRQPLFRDIDRHVCAQGFELFHLNRVYTNYGNGRWVPYGRGQLQFGDAYYLRTRLEGLSADALARLIFLALYYGFADYALHVFRHHATALETLPGESGVALRRELAALDSAARRGGRAFAGQARRVLNKLLYFLLLWRRWNGRSGDNDLDYPIR
ncbi:MAG: FkbM family methyltransferase [Gaiellaceae bacterium]